MCAYNKMMEKGEICEEPMYERTDLESGRGCKESEKKTSEEGILRG